MPRMLEVFMLAVVCIVGSGLVLWGLSHQSVQAVGVGVFEMLVAYVLTTFFEFGEQR